jgi:ribonucleoside-diphosphate reductase alpha chain
MIAGFSFDDEDMLTCKFGNWWELNEQRGRANNSAVLMRHLIKEKEFFQLWKKIEKSGSGEPGLYFSNDRDWFTNPCCEIALRPFQFCNLCEVNVSDITSQQDLDERVKVAAFIGTLQAGYTDFHYLRDIWRRTTEKDALIGVGMTGIGSGEIMKYDLSNAADIVLATNQETAQLININAAARATCVKPSGTSSCVLGTSSGVHAWHNEYYIRRIRLGKNEALYTYLSIYHPELLEDDFFKPTIQAIVSIPQMAPKGSILRTESPIQLLERIKFISDTWIKNGHRSGNNTHNVSATVSIKENEWEAVGRWMWDNREAYNGLSVLPYDGGSYVQAPFEDITEDKYNEMVKLLKDIDLSKVVEMEDMTDLSGEAACAGGACEIK